MATNVLIVDDEQAIADLVEVFKVEKNICSAAWNVAPVY